ncbi:Cytochrome c, mono-and diheme variants [Onishia taeanensis]|uniref:Cytochrome c, mono-and diheme variants n=1 Tax=Onishia taeanensis TaxID=284577 RepID=A0A1G7N9W7_9GAMM|nr:cytochrome c [Halomonas taeanensis]SDF70823.1 Cytochrome c, mono-and diheme variants [Halomonas taeanensis]
MTRFAKWSSVLPPLALAVTTAHAQQPVDDAQVKKGAYLAKAGDCTACHTAPEGEPFAGGLPMSTPIGTIYSTNITPDNETGIGRYTVEDFANALRNGEAKDGHQLYPAMPYPSFSTLTDEDVEALYAYFQHGVEPVAKENRDSDISWPLNMRWPLNIWAWMFAPDEVGFTPDDSQSDEWNRGAYLVEGLGHCGTCHTPRGMAFQEKGYEAGDEDYLAGAELDGWYAFNITGDEDHGVGGWSDEQLVTYLESGSVPGKAQAAGPMGEAIEHSLRFLTRDDLKAIATYLKSVPAVSEPGPSRFAQGTPADDVDRLRGVALTEDAPQDQAARLYLGACASCHGALGQGSQDGHYPPLINNSVMGSTQLGNLTQVVLHGIHRETNEGELLMPALDQDISNDEAASLMAYLVEQFGHPDAQAPSAERIAELRGPNPEH